MERRDFIKVSTLAGVAVQQGDVDFLEATLSDTAAREIPKRAYRDDVALSTIGFGGVVLMGMTQKEADATVAASVDRGVNYFDVAPTYGEDHEAERKLGPALKPHRHKAFLACKTTKRDADGARLEMEASLSRLQTDSFDLYQLHAMGNMQEVEQVLAPGGAMETFEKAREEGKVRYLGFSAHSADVAVALMDRYSFDSVLFPINYVCYAQGNFGPQVVAKAKQKNVARLALKALAYTPWAEGKERAYAKCWYQPIDQLELARQALRFTLSEEVTAAIPPGENLIYQMALNLGAEHRPMTKEERDGLLATSTELKPIFSAA